MPKLLSNFSGAPVEFIHPSAVVDKKSQVATAIVIRKHATSVLFCCLDLDCKLFLYGRRAATVWWVWRVKLPKSAASNALWLVAIATLLLESSSPTVSSWTTCKSAKGTWFLYVVHVICRNKVLLYDDINVSGAPLVGASLEKERGLRRDASWKIVSSLPLRLSKPTVSCSNTLPNTFALEMIIFNSLQGFR